MIPASHSQWPGATHILLLGCILLFLTSSPSFSQAIEVDADRQWNFAEHLFAKEDYDSAITEYERFTFLFPGDPRVDDALYQIGMAYFNTERYAQATKAFYRVIDRAGGRPIYKSDTAARAYVRTSECYVNMGETGQAINNLNNLASVAESPQLQDEARYRIGWILLEEGLWRNAAFAFSQIPPENRDPYRLPELFKAVEEYRNIPQKNPTAAGALAVIPGMGYLYCTRYRDALVAFVLNGGMILATYKAFESDNPALGGLLTLVELGFYSGNIYGSIASAHKYNQDQTERFISGIRRRYKIDLSLSPDPKGALLAFRYSF